MADNKFVDGNWWGYQNKTSRPLASFGAVNLRFISAYTGPRDIQIELDFSTAGQVAVEPIVGGAQDGTTYRQFLVAFFDRKGNQAAGNNGTATNTVDVSALDTSTPWRLVLKMEAGPLSVGIQDYEEAEIILDDVAGLFAGGSTYTIDTVALTAAQLQVYYGGQAVPAGGAIDLGSFAAGGTTEPFQLNVRALEYPAEVTSTSFTADVAGFENPAPNGTVYPNTNGYFLLGSVDTSGAAGAKTGTVTLVTAAGSYLINVNYTLV